MTLLPPPGGGKVPFTVPFSEVIPHGGGDLRCCGLCGAVVPTLPIDGQDYAQRHVEWHAALRGLRP